MSRLQLIENALSAINPAAFQELCDSFLAMRNANYAALSRTGSQSGKQKTIKGTPDTFLLLPNGKFIFVEYSTNIKARVSKLRDDINKCIDESKTGVPLNQISEIVLCINYNLKAQDLQSLRDLISHTRIILTIYTLDALAIELHLNHRDLANYYLGIPVDTGQIVSIEQFISEYNKASQGISTPLNNTFLHRENEIQDFKYSLVNYDFVIVTGPPGIGKTKLALEGINSFLAENLTFSAYCVSYKNHTLLEDLFIYFSPDKDYLLFVDDANRIDAFNQITGFYRAARKGKLKIVITVRDYAFQEINNLCYGFAPQRIDLAKLTDEHITDIIKDKPFEILNPNYQREIIRIGDGNPRLAIMAALLAKAEENIQVLSDMSDLFEKYFTTFISDKNEFANELNIKCLGLISFFYTVPFKNREITTSILDNFNIDYFKFIESIDLLEKLELVDIQYEHVKISEQNIATYYFYKTFIKDKLLSFEVLLNKYFLSHTNRFKDSVIPANNTFGSNRVMDLLLNDLRSYWQIIKFNKQNSFKFLSIFWHYLQQETLAFLYEIIASLSTVPQPIYIVSYNTNDFSHRKNEIIELLGEFFWHSYSLKSALELSFEYVRKLPDKLPELLHKIRERLVFDEDDIYENFIRQTTLYDLLLNGLKNNDDLYSATFFELSKTFLSFKFRHTRAGRNYSIYWYYYPVPDIPSIHEFRKRIWDALDINFSKHFAKSFDLLKDYAKASPDVIKPLMQFDTFYLIDIINKHLSPSVFEHCKYVQEQIRWCKRMGVVHSSFATLKIGFTNPLYEMYGKLHWDRLRDKESYEFDDYKGYEKLKEADIRNSFVFIDHDDVIKFYDNFSELRKFTTDEWGYLNSFEYILDENFLNDFEIGCSILKIVIDNNNEINYVPTLSFKNQLKSRDKANKLWSIISNRSFNHKSLWELSFYSNIDEAIIENDDVINLINTFGNLSGNSAIHLDSLDKYLSIEPNLFQIILSKIVEANEQKDANLKIRIDFFTNHFEKLGNDLNLIEKAYLQQKKTHLYFDYGGKGLLNILKVDPAFLFDYVKDFKDANGESSHKDLSFIWTIDNIEQQLYKVFDLLAKNNPYYGISDHFSNAFFRTIENEELRIKAKDFLLSYCASNFNVPNRINMIVDIVRHTMRNCFEEILLMFVAKTQSVELFSKIWWRGNGTFASGDVILSDIEAADWQNIYSILEKSPLGFELSQIKQYVQTKITDSLKAGEWERRNRFLKRF